uniref:Barrier to autointegration factor n=1 Tax=Strongyloides papillosus TaxID=174720 RepID=A0A0N5BI71_STREA
MSPTKKFQNFTERPMGDKKVKAIPGVGNVLSKKFRDGGIVKAFQLYGMYLFMGKDDNEFKEWLKSQFHVDAVNIDQITESISEYARRHK